MTHRGWIFTLNNPDGLLDVADFPGAKYLVYSEELSASGTDHLQGYVEFERPKRLAGVSKLLPRAHWEPRKGTPAEAAAYCKKNDETHIDGPYEWGSVPHQGERSDLLAVKTAVDAGTSQRDLWSLHFTTMVKFHRGVDRYTSLVATSRVQKSHTTLIVGPPGGGKSQYCQQFVGAYWKPRGEWWNGYEGQDTVILDEFYGWLPYDTLLRVCDFTPLTVPTKGGFVAFTASRVFITSNRLPEQWYKFGDTVQAPLASFLRRVDKYLLFEGNIPGHFQEVPDYITLQRLMPIF
jgi:hypothetical protein